MFYDDLEGWGGVGGRKAEEGEGRCTHIVDSHCHTAETNTTLQSNYMSINKKGNELHVYTYKKRMNTFFSS